MSNQRQRVRDKRSKKEGVTFIYIQKYESDTKTLSYTNKIERYKKKGGEG